MPRPSLVWLQSVHLPTAAGVLDEATRALLRDERTVLGHIRELLVGQGATPEPIEQLRPSASTAWPTS